MIPSLPPPPLSRVHFLRVNHVAKRLGVADRTVRHYVETGVLPAFRRGMRILVFLESDVENFRVEQDDARKAV
jgi:excisionase family DNA binding protein